MRTELVTTLKRRATKVIASLENDRKPVLIIQHGRPAAYLLDVDTYETLQRRVAILESTAGGERAVEEGRTLTHEQAKKRLSRWLK